jgi:threonine/homoserine efflux transporter RhtA
MILGQVLSTQQVAGVLAVMLASVGAVYLTTDGKTGLAAGEPIPENERS